MYFSIEATIKESLVSELPPMAYAKLLQKLCTVIRISRMPLY